MTTQEQPPAAAGPGAGRPVIRRATPALISRGHFVAVTGWYGYRYHHPTSTRGVAFPDQPWEEMKKLTGTYSATVSTYIPGTLKQEGILHLRNASNFVSFAVVQLVAGLEFEGIPTRPADGAAADHRASWPRPPYPQRRLSLPDGLWAQAESIVATGYAPTVDALLNEAIEHLLITVRQDNQRKHHTAT